MAKIFGALTENDNEFGFLQTTGQSVVYSVAEENIRMHNEDMVLATGAFISEVTEEHKTKYKLPPNGRMQRRGKQSRPGVSKASGEWDVAFPLEDFMEGFAGNDIDLAYTSANQLDLHFTSAFNSNRNTLRFEMLKRLFKNTTTTFTDEYRGTLTIQPLANGTAGELYPPIIGSETEAIENMYLYSSYTAAQIDDTNNPIPTMVRKLTSHFGDQTGGKNIVILNNYAQTEQLAGLSDYREVVDDFIMPGSNVDVPFGFPAAPGITKGRSNGAWLNEWDWIPANYLLAIDLEVEAPLKIRVDPAATQIARGLSMVFQNEDFPFLEMYWRNRFGIGTANRLNGVLMDLVTGSSYTIPTIYQ